jgi:hypothetical protein
VKRVAAGTAGFSLGEVEARIGMILIGARPGVGIAVTSA